MNEVGCSGKMKRFVSNLADGSYINIQADRIVEDKENNLFIIYEGDNLVGCVDKSILMSCHISEKEV